MKRKLMPVFAILSILMLVGGLPRGGDQDRP